MAMQEFNTIEEMLEYLEEARKQGLEKAKGHHLKVSDFKHGDHFVRLHPCGVMIFGEVLEHTDYPEDSATIKTGRISGYVYARCYSTLCPEGEFGDTHITMIQSKIPKDLFELARVNGWLHTYPSN
jgi:hypothetical protein